MGFLLCRILIFSRLATLAPPRATWTDSFREAIVVVLSAMSERRRLRAGLRVDFRRMVAVGVAEVEPGAAGVEDVFGGGGCGG
jgi:hypothetical protein